MEPHHNSLFSEVEKQHPAEISLVLSEISDSASVVAILRMFEEKKKHDVFSFFSVEVQKSLSEHFSNEELLFYFSPLPSNEKADLFVLLSPDQKEFLNKNIPKTEVKEIITLASYPIGSCGSVMISDFIGLKLDLTAEEALKIVKQKLAVHEDLGYCIYALTKKDSVAGYIKLKSLILAKPHSLINDLVEPVTYSVNVLDRKEEAPRKLALYGAESIPVVDNNQIIQGVITQSLAVTLMEEEATEDFHKTAIISKNIGSVREVSLKLLFKSRIRWLVLLVFFNIFSGAGIEFFEELIDSNIGLIFFLPLLIGSGGNAGSQSATLMIRALATGDVDMSDWKMLFKRELMISFALGVSMSCVVFFIGYYRVGAELATVVSITMILVVMFGSLMGMLLPFILSKVKCDPATASAPLITSIVDNVGVIIYFSVATYVVHNYFNAV